MPTLTSQQSKTNPSLWELYRDGVRVSTGTKSLVEQQISGNAPLPSLPPVQGEAAILSTASGARKFEQNVLPAVDRANQAVSTATQNRQTMEQNQAAKRTSDMELIPPDVQAELDATKSAERKTLDDRLKNFDEQKAAAEETAKALTLAATTQAQGQIARLTSQWQSRRKLLEQSSKANLSNWQQQLIRSGASEYSPGITGDFLSAKEQEGLQKLQDLDDEYNSTVADINNALENKQYKLAAEKTASLLQIEEAALKAVQENVKEANTLNKDLLKQYNDAQKQKFDQLVKPKQDIMLDVKANGAPPEIIDAIEAAETVADAVKAAGDYLQNVTTSGIVGEYMFYKKDAIARGQTPVDFNAYQTMDANRKVSIARASQPVAGTELTTGQQSVFNRIVDKYNSSEAIKALDRASQLKQIIANVEANPKDPAGQLNLIYAYIKSLDTDSAVREGEIDLVRSINSYLQKFSLAFERIQSGKPVDPAVALNIAKSGKDLIKAIETTANRKKAVFDAQAKTNGTAVYGAWKSFSDSLAESNPPLGESLIQDEDQAKVRVQEFLQANPQQMQQVRSMIGGTFEGIDHPLTYGEVIQVLGL